MSSSRGGELPASGISFFSEGNFIAIALNDGDWSLEQVGTPPGDKPLGTPGKSATLHQHLGSG